MREWLTVIVVLLIVTVVLDGLRRMRNNRRTAIRMSLSMHQGTKKEDLETYGSELPNGGARVSNVREQDAALEFNHRVKESRKSKVSHTGRPYRIPEQVALNLDEHVPMLMDSVEQQQSKASTKRPANSAEGLSEKDFAKNRDNRIEPSISESSFSGNPNIASKSPEDETEYEDVSYGDDIDPLFADSSDKVDLNADITAEDFDDEELIADIDDTYEEERVTDSALEEDDFPEPEDVLVLNVMAHKGDAFVGDHLLDVVLDSGMRFGSMNIFHHHERDNGEGGIWYSMANIVKPGTFDLNTMSDFVTPGVSLFMTLPLDGDSKLAFEAMLRTAKAIAVQLNGELKDENRSVLTQQTIEHYRTRIREFERKQLSRSPA